MSIQGTSGGQVNEDADAIEGNEGQQQAGIHGASSATAEYPGTEHPGMTINRGPQPGDTLTGTGSNATDYGGQQHHGSAETTEPSDSSGQAEDYVERTDGGNPEGDYDEAGALKDRDRFNGRLDGISQELAKLRGKSDDLDARIQEIQQDIRSLKAMVNDLVGSGGRQSPAATFQLVAQLSVIEDDAFAAAEDAEEDPAEDDDSAPHGFFKQLRKMFRGIWALLWRLLSRFRMVKEWSLSGELGPVPFTGKVGVSVTFGR